MGHRPLISTLRWALLATLLFGVFAGTASAAGPPADIGVTVNDDTDPVSAGTDVVYTIVVTNGGPNAADATVADALPAGTTFNSLDAPAGFSCTTPAVGATGSISCSTPNLAPGGSASFYLSVHIPSGATDGSSLSDTATVSTTATDSNATNDSATEPTTIQNNADLGITKSGSPDTVLPGGTITYTIDVTNSGPADAANATWNDALPAEVTFVSASQTSGPTFTCSTPSPGMGGTVSCSIASLPSGSAASFTVTVLVTPNPGSGSISNTATVGSSTLDLSEAGNNSSTVTTAIQTAADLSVTKSDSPDPVEAGGTLTYTITVTNNGPTAAGNVVLSDDIPAGTSFSSIAGGPQDCSAPDPGSGGTIECTIPTLASGGSVTYTLTVAVLTTQDNGSTITNTATVGSSSNTDPNPGNDSATATTTVQASADLVATSSDSPDPVHAGDQLTYTIDVFNNGPASAHGVTLADALPAGTTFVSVTAPAGFSCSTPAVGSGGTVSCSGGTVDLGGATFVLVVRVLPSVAPGTMLSNTATVSSSTPEANPGSESTTATTTVDASADLAVSKSGSPDAVDPGGEVTYTIDLENKGPSDAASVTMSDPLPAGTTFVSLSAPPGQSGFSCSTPTVGSGGTVTCTAASLAAGAKPTFKIVVQVASNASPGTVSNTATVSSSTPDPASGNDSSTATTTVKPTADVAVTKGDSPDPVTAGTNLTYTMGVSNNGPSPATSVALSDDLPAGTTFVSLSVPSGFSCTTPSAGSGGTVNCTSTSMGNGATASFTLVVRVAPDRPSGSTFTNTVAVSRAEDDPDSSNDTATTTTSVTRSADVSTVVSDSPDPVTAGANLKYTADVTNGGPSAASNVTFTDDLPAGTTFVSLDGPAAFSCTTPAVGAAGTVTCTASNLGGGASAGFTLVVHVAPDRPGGSTLTNTAGASHGESDPNAANDSSASTTTVTRSADLSTSVSDSPDPVGAGNGVTYHVQVHNGGPSDASQPRLSMPIPRGTTLIGAAQTDGSAFHCTSNRTTVSCAADSLANGATASIDVLLRPGRAQRGTISVHPTASSSTADPDSSNDAASESTTVTPAPTRVTIGRTATKRGSGVILVAIGCQGFRGDSCPVAVTLTFKSPHSDLAPISARKTIAAGRRSIVYLIGPHTERRRIKGIRVLPVRLDATNRNGTGATRITTIVGTH